METIRTSLFHLIREPRMKWDRNGHPAVILLHGRGADEEDLFGLAPFLDPRLLVLSVRAPYPLPETGGYTWFAMNNLGLPDPGMFRTSRQAVTTFVGDAIQGYPIDPESLFLFGFSMGTMMAFSVSLADPRRYCGVIAHSGFVPEHQSEVPRTGIEGTGFFIAHGVHDPVIPVALARRTKDLFERSDAVWEYHEYPIGHEISQESLTDAATWLQARLEVK